MLVDGRAISLVPMEEAMGCGRRGNEPEVVDWCRGL